MLFGSGGHRERRLLIRRLQTELGLAINRDPLFRADEVIE